MTYLISGLNGSLEKYKKLKNKAGIGENDVIYVISGIARGDLSLLSELSMQVNVYPVMGRAEWMALKLLEAFEKMLKNGSSPTPEYIAEMKKWMLDGGQEVLDAYREMDGDMKEGVLDYLGDFACFEELELKGKSFIILPAGIKRYSTSVDIYDLDPEELLEEPLDPKKKYFAGKTVVSADTGCIFDDITKINDNICMGCRNAACLRLEDMAEFYA